MVGVLDEFEAVAEWIGDIAALDADIRVISHDLDAGVSQSFAEPGQVRDHEGRVRLAGRSELRLDAEVNIRVLSWDNGRGPRSPYESATAEPT